MLRDPKFGYHWIWLTPVLFVLLAASAGMHKMRQLIGRLRSQYVEWRHSKIKRLKHLSGIHK